MSEMQYINLEEGLGRVRGNKTLYRRMLTLFQQSQEFDALAGFLAAADYQKAGDSAHAIKGITGNLSLTALFNLSNELMQQLRNGAPDETLVANFNDALEKTRAIVNQTVIDLS